MGRSVYSDETKEAALRMRRANMPVRQIAAELGISHCTIEKWIEKAGMVRHREGKVRIPTVTKRRQAAESTHVMGQPQKAFLPPEMVAALKGETPEPTPETEPDVEQRVRDLVRAGDLLQAAAVLDDAGVDGWQRFGEMVAPDFLKPWQCGRLFFYLACGVHRGIALARVGIHLGDYEEWLARAANRKEPWQTLVALCASAQASACARMQDEVNSKRPGWQAVAWSLEKISPEIYARHVADDDVMKEGAFADVGDDNLKRAALAYIVSDNNRKAVDVEFIDLDEIEGRADG